ncbi:hypothetical protein AB6C61_10460 [Vibrio splendidus]
MSINWESIKQAQEVQLEKTTKSNDSVSLAEKEANNASKAKEDSTRSWLTTGFIFGLFLLIVLAAVYVMEHNAQVVHLTIEAKEKGLDVPLDNLSFLSFESIFSLIFNSFGTPLGFIIGYYFKEKVSK